MKQSLISRLWWFVVGGCISVGINAGVFHLTIDLWHWPDWQGYALSLTVVTVIFSLWNYFLNFRTSAGWRECLARYLGVIAICYVLNYGITLAGFKQLAATREMKFLIIAVVQIGVSGLKFLLYHFWVYPRGPKSAHRSEQPIEAHAGE